MMLSEFEKLTGLEVTTAEYEKIEAEYMESPDDKAKFCKMWLKKGGLQRLHNARLEEIEHLKKTIEDLEHKLDEEQDWQISHKYGTHYQKTSYDHLTKRCSNGHQFESEAKAAEFISSQYGFDKDRIVFIYAQFDDIDSGTEVHGEIPMMKSDAKHIVDGIEHNINRIQQIIVHCDAGYSRSPAVAAAIAKAFGVDDEEYFSGGRYCPNRHVYRTMLNEFAERGYFG